MKGSANLGSVVDATRDPDKVAIVEFDGERSREVTYRALDDTANAVARGLALRGFSRGERIAILSANNANYLAVHLGIMRTGLVSVPVNFRLPSQLIEYILGDCNARFVFADRDRRPSVSAGLDAVALDDADEFGAFLDPGPFDMVEPRRGEAATFLYTSGSTGRPKGVVLSHDAQRWVVEMRLPPSGIEHERMLIAAPLYHMNALALSHLVFAGHANMVLMPQFKVKPYADAVGRFRCTWLTSVPPMIAMLLNDPEAMRLADFSSVKNLRMGSAPASASLLDNIKKAFPAVRVQNVYGTTEGSPIVFGPHPDGKPTPELSLGCRHWQVDLRLVDATGSETNEGVLQIRSPGLMTGYHNRTPEQKPFTPDGYYVTGDVFRRDADGFYYFVGREDDMFVSGGENIFPGAVERMLETHPDVIQACVVPIEDAIKGYKPVAFVRVVPGAVVTVDDLKAFSLKHGAAYQHPRAIWFVDEFPLASTNKLDRAQLMQRAGELAASGNLDKADQRA